MQKREGGRGGGGEEGVKSAFSKYHVKMCSQSENAFLSLSHAHVK